MTLRDIRRQLFGSGHLRYLLGPAALVVGGWCALPLTLAAAADSARARRPSVVRLQVMQSPCPGHGSDGAELPAQPVPGWGHAFALQHNPDIAATRANMASPSPA